MSRAHGTRTKYVHEGCKCLPCSDANRDYAAKLAARKRKPWRVHHTAARTFVVRNFDTKEIRLRTVDREEAHALRDALNSRVPLVDEPWADADTLDELRAHLHALRAAGVGLRQIARRSGVGRTRLTELPTASRVRIGTAEAVLSVRVSDVASRALIPAGETWRLIEEMLVAGATRTRISHALGNKSHGLQLKHDLVTRANADRVRELHDRFFVGSEQMRSACRCDVWRNDELERKRLEKAASRQRLSEATG